MISPRVARPASACVPASAATSLSRVATLIRPIAALQCPMLGSISPEATRWRSGPDIGTTLVRKHRVTHPRASVTRGSVEFELTNRFREVNCL